MPRFPIDTWYYYLVYMIPYQLVIWAWFSCGGFKWREFKCLIKFDLSKDNEKQIRPGQSVLRRLKKDTIYIMLDTWHTLMLIKTYKLWVKTQRHMNKLKLCFQQKPCTFWLVNGSLRSCCDLDDQLAVAYAVGSAAFVCRHPSGKAEETETTTGGVWSKGLSLLLSK